MKLDLKLSILIISSLITFNFYNKEIKKEIVT